MAPGVARVLLRGGLWELWMVWIGEGGEELVSALDGLLLGCTEGGREGKSKSHDIRAY